jgi:hypothetical protein
MDAKHYLHNRKIDLRKNLNVRRSNERFHAANAQPLTVQQAITLYKHLR